MLARDRPVSGLIKISFHESISLWLADRFSAEYR